MKIETNNNTSFGMALHMPKQKNIAKKIGPYCAEQADLARPLLKQLAKDVDIYIQPENRSNRAGYKGFTIIVKPLKEKNIFKILFSNRPYEEAHASMFELNDKKDMTSLLIDKTTKIKEQFLKYNV